MALYRYSQFIALSQHAAFNALHNPGVIAPHSGIYRCEGCAREVASNSGDPLPPQNHHVHPPTLGAVQWRLIVCTQQP